MGDVMLWVLGIHAPLFRGVGMALLSLLQAGRDAGHPAPAAVHLVLSGAVWRGITLIAFAGLVIGLIDTALRPMSSARTPGCPTVSRLSRRSASGKLRLQRLVIGRDLDALFIAAFDSISNSINIGSRRLKVLVAYPSLFRSAALITRTRPSPFRFGH